VDLRPHPSCIPAFAHVVILLCAGIFGQGPVASGVPSRAYAAEMTKSSVFDAPVQAPPPSRPTTGPHSSAGVGGIFGAAVQEPTARREAVTKSSVDGGIFSTSSAYGQSAHDAPEPPRSARGPKPQVDVNRVAGQSTKVLAEVPSGQFRSNPNKPSIDGGIFGAPPPMSKPDIKRGNPNASSIPGGIFG